MEIELDTSLNAARNASLLFERAKKLEAKVRSAEEALRELEKKIREERVRAEVKVEDVIKERRERAWYEKFRWFYSSEGNLIIGGRDATTNEILIKKHTRNDSIVLHANIVGAPFFTILSENPAEVEVGEAAVAAASFSRAWRLGYGNVEVYWVRGEQVSKSAPAGEYLKKGAFMIYGKKNWLGKVPLGVAVGVKESSVAAGPRSAIEKWAEKFVLLEPGQEKQGRIAREVARILKADVNEVQRVLPAGGSKIIKKRA